MPTKETDRAIANIMHNVVYLRKKNGYTRKQMAEIMGVSMRTMYMFENGIHPPRLSCNYIYYLSKHFNIPIAYFFEKRFDEETQVDII